LKNHNELWLDEKLNKCKEVVIASTLSLSNPLINHLKWKKKYQY